MSEFATHEICRKEYLKLKALYDAAVRLARALKKLEDLRNKWSVYKNEQIQSAFYTARDEAEQAESAFLALGGTLEGEL